MIKNRKTEVVTLTTQIDAGMVTLIPEPINSRTRAIA